MKKTLQSHNALASVRTMLGLTQEQMAMHLGMSKGMVKMVETNRRSLTTGKLLKLSALEIKLLAIPHFDDGHLPLPAAEVDSRQNGNYELEMLHCSYQETELKGKLKKMELNHSFIKTRLYKLDALAKLNPDTGSLPLSIILQVRARLLKKLMNCNPREQEKIKKKIILLQAEAAFGKTIHPH